VRPSILTRLAPARRLNVAGTAGPVIAGVTLPKVVLPISVLSGLKDLFDADVTAAMRGNYAGFHRLSTAHFRDVLDLDRDVREVRKMR
jgi:hypothetical protein